MVSDAIIRELQPGDIIRISSREDLLALNPLDSAGLITPMTEFANCELTVKRIEDGCVYAKVFVEENSWWWRNTFVESVSQAESIEPCEEIELLNLLWR